MMKTFSLNLKKCLICSLFLVSGLASAAPVSLHHALQPKSQDQVRYRYWMKTSEWIQAHKGPIATQDRSQLLRGFKVMMAEKSWMLRSAALQTLPLFEKRVGTVVSTVYPKILKDPAQAVRLDAVQVLAQIRPPHWKEWLKASCKDSSNFHKGQALWGAAAALRTLEKANGLNPNPKLAFKKRFELIAKK